MYNEKRRSSLCNIWGYSVQNNYNYFYSEKTSSTLYSEKATALDLQSLATSDFVTYRNVTSAVLTPRSACAFMLHRSPNRRYMQSQSTTDGTQVPADNSPSVPVMDRCSSLMVELPI